jgi:hypothetical protein
MDTWTWINGSNLTLKELQSNQNDTSPPYKISLLHLYIELGKLTATLIL